MILTWRLWFGEELPVDQTGKHKAEDDRFTEDADDQTPSYISNKNIDEELQMLSRTLSDCHFH